MVVVVNGDDGDAWWWWCCCCLVIVSWFELLFDVTVTIAAAVVDALQITLLTTDAVVVVTWFDATSSLKRNWQKLLFFIEFIKPIDLN